MYIVPIFYLLIIHNVYTFIFMHVRSFTINNAASMNLLLIYFLLTVGNNIYVLRVRTSNSSDEYESLARQNKTKHFYLGSATFCPSLFILLRLLFFYPLAFTLM